MMLISILFPLYVTCFKVEDVILLKSNPVKNVKISVSLSFTKFFGLANVLRVAVYPKNGDIPIDNVST